MLFRKVALRLVALLTLTAALHVGADDARADAGDLVILTVSGAVSKPNRGPTDTFDDGVLTALDERFERARTFTYGELLTLPQRELELAYPNWPRAVRFRGPELSAVLAAAGAEGSEILVQALDGYAPGFGRADVAKADMVLALQADGKPIPLGGRGPLWLVFEQGALDPSAEDDAGLVWAVFHIKVSDGE